MSHPMQHDPRTTIIDITPDGRIRDQPRTPALAYVALAALAASVVLILAVVAFVAIALLPYLLVAGLVLALVARFRRKRVLF